MRICPMKSVVIAMPTTLPRIARTRRPLSTGLWTDELAEQPVESDWLETVSHLTPVPSSPEDFAAFMSARGNSPIELPPPPTQPRLMTLKVSLQETEPPVWRR